RLSRFTAFSASTALALALDPSIELDVVRRRQEETSEARRLLTVKPDLTIGGARDVRASVQAAAIGAVLEAGQVLDVKSTLIAGRSMQRTLARLADQFPRLAALAARIEDTPGLVEAISLTLDERGEVLDSASPELMTIRRDLRLAHDRLLQKLQRIISDPKNGPYLQEAIITQRDGRYVIPLKADFKNRIRGIVHDQSASGATLFIEPLTTVELNNTWRELQLAELQEIRRILTALSALIGQQASRIVGAVDILARIDLNFAKSRYADELRAHEPALHAIRPRTPAPAAAGPARLTSRSHPGTTIKIIQGRHPLLNPEQVVPIDVELDESTYALVITGPNTGGKTVSLKTVGLLVLMAQCGLHIPASDGSALSVFPKVFADIGDEQSIEQSLSTFSAHITNTIRILRQADAQSLVILDELGAGTDPAEGAALARAMLSYLLDVGATTLVATHYPELKGYAYDTPGVRNASMEFDLDSLAPTYRLIIGLPGRSNAFAIAARLGLDATIIEDARQMVGVADLEADRLLEEIHAERVQVRAERTRAENARVEAEETERDLARELEAIDDERRRILDQARADARRELDTVRDELAELKRRMAHAALAAPGPADDEEPLAAEVLEAVDEALERAEAAHTAAEPARPAARAVAAPRRPIRLGDTVKLKALNSIGVVTALTATEAEVQVGRMRIRARLNEVELRGSPESAPLPQPEPAVHKELPVSPGLELDIRGQTVEEALPELERYLDAAYLAGLPWVRIIHGKGTGKLRTGVRTHLRASPVVKSHATGQEGEGGDGVTVVRLAIADDDD
ncbi:MAG: endonuclease MutS2, partial [Anaerolineales bacterium]